MKQQQQATKPDKEPKEFLAQRLATLKAVEKHLDSLWDALVGPAGFDVGVTGIKVKQGRLVRNPVMVPNAVTGVDEHLVVHKKCLADAIGLGRDVEMWHVPFTMDDEIEATQMRLLLVGHWEAEGLIPFGNGLKGTIRGDKEVAKYYTLRADYARHIFEVDGVGAAEVSAYGSILYSDAPFYMGINTLVLTKEEYDSRVAKFRGIKTPGWSVGVDGSGALRPSTMERVSKTVGRRSKSIQCRMAPTYHNHENVPLGKGVMDAALYSEEQFDRLFGEDYDAVIIRGDMVKTHPEAAKSGLWTYAFTYMVGRRYSLPIMWEITQFLKDDEEVRTVLKENTENAISKLEKQLSTKEGVIEYVSAEVAELTAQGKDAEVETNLLRALTSGLDHKFVWIQRQLRRMIIGHVHRIVKSYGTEALGQLCLTDNDRCNYDRRYISGELVKALGGDNDGDLIGFFWNNKLRKAAYFRYPCVAGPVVVDIPPRLVGKFPDHHPEMVELFDKHGINLDFDRNVIKENATRIEAPVEEAQQIAERIILGSGIGSGTLAQHIFMKAGLHKEAKQAGLSIEAGAVGLKYDTSSLAFECPWVDKQLREKYPNSYVSFTKRAPSSWKGFEVEFEDTCMDANLLLHGAGLAKEFETGFETNLVYPNRVKISLAGVTQISKRRVEAALKVALNYNKAVQSILSANLDEEAQQGQLSALIKSIGNYGKHLDDDTLRIAIREYCRKASAENTGAFCIHLAGHRIHLVFDKDIGYETVRSVEHVRKSAKDNFQVRVWSPKEINLEAVRAAAAEEALVVLHDGRAKISNFVFNLGAKELWPAGKLTLIRVDQYVGVRGVSKHSLMLHVLADTSDDGKEASLGDGASF